MDITVGNIVAHYHWQGMLLHLSLLISATLLSAWLLRKIPAIDEMRQWNRREDKPKKLLPKYRRAIKQNSTVALYAHAIFFFLLIPFVVTLDEQPLWGYFFDALLILLVYDFFYYITHRFIFHGKILLRVHALHHQSRDISYIDSRYVHPLETAIGLSLFMGVAVSLAALFGGYHAVSFFIAQFIFNQVNQINHIKFSLDYFPFQPVNFQAKKHAIHHLDMQRGNYSTLSPLYDWLFGTLE